MAQTNFKKTNRVDAQPAPAGKIGLFIDENDILCKIDEHGNISEIMGLSSPIYDSNGKKSIDYENRTLHDASEIVFLDYLNRLLKNSAGTTIIDIENQDIKLSKSANFGSPTPIELSNDYPTAGDLGIKLLNTLSGVRQYCTYYYRSKIRAMGVDESNFADFNIDGRNVIVNGKLMSALYIDGTGGIIVKTSGIEFNYTIIPEYSDNAAAKAAGLIDGRIYRTSDTLKIVHP